MRYGNINLAKEVRNITNYFGWSLYKLFANYVSIWNTKSKILRFFTFNLFEIHIQCMSVITMTLQWPYIELGQYILYAEQYIYILKFEKSDWTTINALIYMLQRLIRHEVLQ